MKLGLDDDNDDNSHDNYDIFDTRPVIGLEKRTFPETVYYCLPFLL